MEINQLLPTISYGDAVGNSAIKIMEILRRMGFHSNIYAENIHPKMKDIAIKADECPKNKPIIYHMAIGCDLAYRIPEFTSTKIMIYHNITPSFFFKGYDPNSERLCEEGRKQLIFLKDYVDFSFADSEYNLKELYELNYKNASVAPLIIDYDDYKKKSNVEIVERFSKDGYTNLLFVGRIAPNKKQDDIIKIFYYYKKFINPESRLILVGSYIGMERYYSELIKLVNDLDLQDVFFTGHIPFESILAFYQISHLFLCMSEHEGFCVPIVEAMLFDLPIIAYRSSAVPATLGNAGFVVSEKNYKAIAELIHIVLNDQAILERLSFNRKARLQELSPERTEKIFMDKIKTIFNLGVQ
mgnify:CR=1 FL=1